jgi:glyoxylase I family protein
MDGIDRFDLVVSDEKRSLRSYHGLLGPVGYVRLGVIAGERGERGERGAYLNRVTGGGWVSIRQRQSDAHPLRMSDTRSGSTTSPSPPPSRVVVDERARWVAQQGATIESGPAEHEYTPGYDPVVFYDPDRIKLELVHDPQDRDLVSVVQELARRVAELESNR